MPMINFFHYLMFSFINTCRHLSTIATLILFNITMFLPLPVIFTPAHATSTASLSCVSGTATAGIATSALLGPPSVPQPQTSGDLVGIILQNTSNSSVGAQYTTFGQLFIKGQLERQDNLQLKISGVGYPLQMDPLAFWPDGSVKMAALTTENANVCGSQQVSALISKSTTASASSPVDLASVLTRLSVSLVFTAGGSNETFDLAAALKNTLISHPNYWLRGALATQARVDITTPGTSTMHITADVTAYADSTITADIQFNNDLAAVNPVTSFQNTLSPLPPLSYTATIFVGEQSVTQTVSQDQYTDWHVIISSNGITPTAISPSGAAPPLNIQHDPQYLEETGAILSYDLTTGVANFQGYMTYINYFLSSAGFGTPLAGNGVTQGMPQTGGRPDIGYTTAYNTIWIITQDSRAMTVALAQNDTGGAIPWNFKLSNGHWLTPGDYPLIWTDPRGGPSGYTDGVVNAPNFTVWQPDHDHQPNLAYVPYIMTGRRWSLDRLNSQAAFALNYDWPVSRCGINAYPCIAAPYSPDLVLNGIDDVRAQAWSFRELKEAAFIGYPGTFEQTYYTKVVSDNWAGLQQITQAIGNTEGEATGWYPPASSGQIRPWQQDYLTGVVALAAAMGDQGAVKYLNWQLPWLSGRIIAPDFNPYDGCAYILIGADPTNMINYDTWSKIEQLTVLGGISNGINGTSQENNPFAAYDYCPLERAALGAVSNIFPRNTKLIQALRWINDQFFNTSKADYAADLLLYQLDPTFNVVPLK